MKFTWVFDNIHFRYKATKKGVLVKQGFNKQPWLPSIYKSFGALINDVEKKGGTLYRTVKVAKGKRNEN